MKRRNEHSHKYPHTHTTIQSGKLIQDTSFLWHYRIFKLEAWSKDLKDIDVNDWMEACKEAQDQYSELQTWPKLLQYKWLMRTYVTLAILHKYNDNIPDTCVNVTHLKAHCITVFGNVNTFWKEVNGQ